MSLNENADILHSILRTVVLVLTPCVCNVAVGTPRFPRFFSQAILHPDQHIQSFYYTKLLPFFEIFPTKPEVTFQIKKI